MSDVLDALQSLLGQRCARCGRRLRHSYIHANGQAYGRVCVAKVPFDPTMKVRTLPIGSL